MSTVSNKIEAAKQEGEIPNPMFGQTMVTVDDKIYLFGGTDGTTLFSGLYELTAEKDCYRWKLLQPKGKCPVGRTGHAMGAIDKQILVYGGVDSDGKMLGDINVFDIGIFAFNFYFF